MTKIVLCIIALCLSITGMILSTVFHVLNLRDIKKLFSPKKLSEESDDSHDNTTDSDC